MDNQLIIMLLLRCSARSGLWLLRELVDDLDPLREACIEETLRRGDDNSPQLSEREMDVLRLIVDGKDNTTIAAVPATPHRLFKTSTGALICCSSTVATTSTYRCCKS